MRMEDVAFPRMSMRLRKFVLTVHVASSGSWLGVGMVMAVLGVTGLVTGDLALRHHAYALMHILDLAIVIPLVLLSIITGLVVSFGTPWGLVRHWWVLVKFAIALGIVTFASLRENYWVRGLAEATAVDPGATLGNLDLYLVVFFILGALGLWMAVVLSVYKPWGKTWWGRRQLAKEIAAAKADRERNR